MVMDENSLCDLTIDSSNQLSTLPSSSRSELYFHQAKFETREAMLRKCKNDDPTGGRNDLRSDANSQVSR